jgi:hypothetical protein
MNEAPINRGPFASCPRAYRLSGVLRYERRPDEPNTSPAHAGAGGADHGRYHTGPADCVRRVAHDIGWQ